ncbi:FAD-dependent oxidoreductase [Vreelandella rituensis]|uniref:FAD-dependent oxidoreductase n=1 Tax=Vreelandella rituensis TaxID=2282306 RepID=A0A368UA81_9GAMM|nr:FAD-dependent oxidoreductase [Halomonas rituensis]RCV93062.1 FAD-dependent oxidoreductase [Halomonas rituensis]
MPNTHSRTPSTAATAIIGAGIAGLACAQRLNTAGKAVQLFEKARGPGGRMSSKRRPQAIVDLGAQYFTARDAEFQEAVARWQQAGCIAPWPERLWQASPLGWEARHDGQLRYAGKPRMSALPRHLAQGLTIHSKTPIETLERDGSQWWLIDSNARRHGPFAQVVISTPAPQAQVLLGEWAPRLSEICRATPQRACWAGWVTFTQPLPVLPGVPETWQIARLAHPALRLISRNQTKPGREEQGESLSLIAHLDWSEVHLESSADEVANFLLDALRSVFPSPTHLPDIKDLGAHRWRYAQPAEFASTQDPKHLTDFYLESNGLALCGDGCRGGRVEDAWLSGHHLGQVLAKT